ncbi:hypothetical protein [Streptomyces sp. TLI_053]|uniref:hypothetical protein n=1 Tax=Streptomyces sp. TLI_053 TaxID=1855352 RepID=UPI0013520739|nr:hypothetical protein [Streptomyces sp. TLI_053]
MWSWESCRALPGQHVEEETADVVLLKMMRVRGIARFCLPGAAQGRERHPGTAANGRRPTV